MKYNAFYGYDGNGDWAYKLTGVISIDQYNAGQENPVETAISDGMMQEKMDQYIAPHSAYSYEDLPTDAFGAYFGANYFDPNSNASLGEQVEKYLNEVLQATEPYFAPNFDALPKDDKSSSTPSKTNTTTTPVYTIE